MTGRRRIEPGRPAPAPRAGAAWIDATVILLAACALGGEPLRAADAVPGTGVAAQVDSWLADAAAAERSGRFAEARDLLRRAQLQAPQDARIRVSLARLGRIDSGAPELADLPAGVVADWARAEIRQARTRADEMARSGRLDDAVEQLAVVREGLVARSLDGGPDVREALAALDRDLADLRQEQAAQQRVTASGERQDRLAAGTARVIEAESGERNRVQARLDRITDLRERGHVELALAEARRLVDQEPDSVAARSLYADLLERVHRLRRLDQQQSLDDIRQELAERLSRSLMPAGSDGMPVYPGDWLNRGVDPAGASGKRNDEPAWRTDIRNRLRGRTAISAEAQNGVDVLNGIALASGISIVIDPEITAGEERPVTLEATQIAVENALSWVCTQMGTRWTIASGGIWIGKPPAEDTVLAVYDIANLIHPGLDQPGKTLDLASTRGNGTALFTTVKDDAKPPTPEEVVDVLKTSTGTATWEDGASGIAIRGTLLYITAPPDIHRLVRQFIASQENAAHVMVKVDTRWLTLLDSDLKEIGVDWQTGSLLSFAHPGSGVFRQNPNSQFSGATSMVLPDNAATNGTSLRSTGLQLNFGFLGFTQVSAILTAAQRNKRGRVLSSPSVTTLNGVRSNIFVGEQTAYIADYDIAGDVYDPVIKTLAIGASLDVKPFVSADRKYVTMDFRPALTTYRNFVDYISAVRAVRVNGLGNTGGNVGNPNGGTGQGDNQGVGNVLIPLAGTYPIELPNVQIYEAATTLTVPDRSSIMIGGFNKTVDQSTDAGVPFLGDLPYIGRLFGRRGRWSEREKLYLLTTITIISYDEEEAKL